MLLVCCRDPTTGNVTVDVPVTMSIVTSASVGSDITSTTLGSSCKLKMKLDISTAGKNTRHVFILLMVSEADLYSNMYLFCLHSHINMYTIFA